MLYMYCPFCGSEQSSVVDKRAVRGSGEIRRRRECIKCKRRYTTYERVSQVELLVIKRDGRKESFDKSKIRAGLERALEKRPALTELDQIVAKIEGKIRTKESKEVESKFIGTTILSELKKVDSVAYLRFISVYREFKNPGDFTKALENLK